MDDNLQTLFFFENGLDTEILLSPCQILTMSEEKWVPDAQCASCALCGDEFNMRNRRHHCRKCGRVFCLNCAPDAAFRTCQVCLLARELDERQQSPQLYDITPVLANARLMNLINSKDDFLRHELYRIIQNSLRNNKCRDLFVKHFTPLLLSTLVEHYTAALRAQSPLFQSLVGIFVNLTATTAPRYAQYLEEANVLVALLSSLQQPLPLQTQILLFHAIRNLSYSFQAAQRIGKFPNFYNCCFQALQTGAMRLQEFVLSIFGNLLKMNLDFVDQILPAETIQGICKQHQTVSVSFGLMFEKSSSAQMMAIRVLNQIMQSGQATVLAKSDYIKHLCTLLNDQDSVKMAALYSLYNALIKLGEIHKHQKEYSAVVLKKDIIDQLLNTTQHDNPISARSAAGILHALGEIDCAKLIKLILEQGLKDHFVQTVKSLIENEVFYDITEHVVELVQLIQRSNGGRELADEIGSVEDVL